MTAALHGMDFIVCAACGWRRDNPSAGEIPTLVKWHFDTECPRRFMGHPMFGLLPRWQTVYDGGTAAPRFHMEITWGSAGFWSPLDLAA